MKHGRNKSEVLKLDDNAISFGERRSLPAAIGGAEGSWVQQLRRRRMQQVRALLVQAGVFVLVPTLLAILYYGFLATPRYVSVAQMTVYGQESGGPGLLGSFLGVATSSSGDKVAVVTRYIQSQTILQTLDAWLDLRGHYSDPSADYLSRLAADASAEDFLEYYLSRVFVEVDTASQIITLKVEAFDADFAKTVAQAVITLSEDLVNNMSEKAREDSLRGARRELALAEERLRLARLALNDFRLENKDIDPAQSAGAIEGIAASLENQLVAARTELAQLKSYMRPDTVRVVALQAQIVALTEQLATTRERLAGESTLQSTPFTQTLAAYEALRIEEEFAKAAYQTAMTALETARAEAERKHAYLVDFVMPSLPDAALAPDRQLGIGTIFLASLLVFLMGRFIFAAIRENMQA